MESIPYLDMTTKIHLFIQNSHLLFIYTIFLDSCIWFEHLLRQDFSIQCLFKGYHLCLYKISIIQSI